MIDDAINKKLNQAKISFLRGDIDTSLAVVDEVIADLGANILVADSIRGLRIFLASLIDEGAVGATDLLGDSAAEGDGGISMVVAQCVMSSNHWFRGDLLEGLWLNQRAIESALEFSPTWQMYASMLLAKKLIDIHISGQAQNIISGMDDLIGRSGLEVCAPIPVALRANIQLQSGEFDKALESANTVMRLAEERETTLAVKLALSVAATACVRLGETAAAASTLELFHTVQTGHVLSDSIARAAIAETTLIAADHGSHDAVEFMRANWQLLGTDAGHFVEDVLRPASLIAIALDAGDAELASQVLRAIERLAQRNPGMPILRTAVDRARRAFAGDGTVAAAIFGPRNGIRPLPRRQPPTVVPPSGITAIPFEAARQARAAEDALAARRAEPAPEIVSDLSLLSSRELEIARLVGRGMTNRQVATRLGISPHTVNFHLRKIFKKLSISTRVQLGRLVAKADRGAQEPQEPAKDNCVTYMRSVTSIDSDPPGPRNLRAEGYWRDASG
ncbi:LuxR C-terminal-related transcriptional regulator [Nocardia sp. NPDC052566]|uniref:helix-turn-helix transcriptional regulator n=1 Tax=Nocardia sp. NPDC052566 TaxID=3364330 RepID=UPI0037C50C8C